MCAIYYTVVPLSLRDLGGNFAFPMQQHRFYWILAQPKLSLPPQRSVLGVRDLIFEKLTHEISILRRSVIIFWESRCFEPGGTV